MAALRQIWLEVSLWIWKYGSRIFAGVLVAAWMLGSNYVDNLEFRSSRFPIRETGQVIPMSWKSVTVFMTSEQATYVQLMDFAWLSGFAGLFCYAVWRGVFSKTP